MNANCSCKCNCTLLVLIASIILGIVAAVLRITAVITVTPAFLWTLLGISVGYLLLTQITSVFIRDCTECVRETLTATLLGALATAVLSVVLLGVTFDKFLKNILTYQRQRLLLEVLRLVVEVESLLLNFGLSLLRRLYTP